MKRWITLFPNIGDEHINKDVGLIPVTMQKYFGYTSSIITVNSHYKGINRECEVVEIPVFLNSSKLSVLKAILMHGKNWDVINTYHFSLLETILWILPYKLINQSGKVYLKMDLSTKYMQNYTNNKIMLFMRNKLLFLYDLISAESSIVCNYINKYYNNRVELIPNGFFWENDESKKLVREKEILHVARMGAECKATEILIDAFEKSLNEHDWNLRLVGSMEKDFKLWYENRIKKNGQLKNRIIYQGEIADRVVMADIYAKAKVFVLCSEYESFGIVLTEALSKGCYLIGTEGINSIRDIVKDERIGVICKTNDSEDLKKKIVKAVSNEKLYEKEVIDFRMRYAEKNYLWKNICSNISQLLNGE